MAITREKKANILASLKDVTDSSVAMAFVHFKGLTVAEVNDLRSELKAEGVRYTVVKKTLLKRALTDAGIQGEMPDLPGEVAFAYLPESAGDDLTAPARSLNVFVKKYKEKLMFLGGVVENRFLTKEETAEIAAIPPVPVLRGMFVNVINAPIQGLAIALNQIAEKRA